MSMPSHSALTQRLSIEFDYTPRHAAQRATRLERLHPPLRAAFITWWLTGAIPALAIEGFTVPRLVEEYNFTLPNAFLTLDWLTREPDRAKHALTQLDEEGYDEILRS